MPFELSQKEDYQWTCWGNQNLLFGDRSSNYYYKFVFELNPRPLILKYDGLPVNHSAYIFLCFDTSFKLFHSLLILSNWLVEPIRLKFNKGKVGMYTTIPRRMYSRVHREDALHVRLGWNSTG